MVSTRQMLTNSNATCATDSNCNAITSGLASIKMSADGTDTPGYLVIATTNAYVSKSGIPNTNVQNVVQNSLLSTTVTNRNVCETCNIQLLDLPEELLTNILSYVGYKNIALLRLVSRQMNAVCMRMLNSGFSELLTYTYSRVQSIKANMPRRESARRKHPLAFECDIIETCYLRLSMMQVKFREYMERGHCCFFSGAVLDEVYAVMKYVRNSTRLENPLIVTNELFDLSAMAIDYFRDCIKPTLPALSYYENFSKLPRISAQKGIVPIVKVDDGSRLIPGKLVLCKNIHKIKRSMRVYKKKLSVLRNALRICKRKSAEHHKLYAEKRKLFAEQRKQSLDLVNRLDECDKKNEEMSLKISTLLEEFNKCKTELQYWRCKSPAGATCTSCGGKIISSLQPLEVYQAVINQGVRPQNEIDNGDNIEESTNDNKLSTHENVGITYNSSSASASGNMDEFTLVVSTAAKILATGTATAKHLKRSDNSAVSLPTAAINGGSNIHHNYDASIASDISARTATTVAFALRSI